MPIGNSARARVRAIFDDEFDPDAHLQQVDLPGLVQRVKRRVVAEPDLADEILTASLDTWVREYAAGRFARMRGLIVTGNMVLTREQLEEKITQQASRFESWYENIGSKGQVRFLSMKKADLMVAVQQRTESGVYDLQVAELFRQVAAGLNDTQSVEDVYTTEQLATMQSKIKVEAKVNGGTHITIKNGDAPVQVTEVAATPTPTPAEPAPPRRRGRPPRNAPPAPAPAPRRPRAGTPTEPVRVRIPAAPRPRRK